MPADPNQTPIAPADGDVAPAPPAVPPDAPLPRRPAPRQTLSYLKHTLSSHRLRPKSKLGQNFLIDLNLLDLTCRAAELGPADSVLEVGTGTASLTALMADQAACVFTVEVDVEMQRLAEEVVGERANVSLFRGDALARKNVLNPEMLAGWAAHTAKFRAPTRKLVANLPYSIATPLISNLLISDPGIERMVVMVQWEIAERMQALPGTKNFNALSVLTQSLADVSTVRKVLPGNFYPQPKVDSAIVCIRPNAQKRAQVGDVPRFRRFLRDLYVHRRKALRQALAGSPAGARPKADVDAKLLALGLDGAARSETLSLADHLRLCAAFGDTLPADGPDATGDEGDL